MTPSDFRQIIGGYECEFAKPAGSLARASELDRLRLLVVYAARDCSVVVNGGPRTAKLGALTVDEIETVEAYYRGGGDEELRSRLRLDALNYRRGMGVAPACVMPMPLTYLSNQPRSLSIL